MWTSSLSLTLCLLFCAVLQDRAHGVLDRSVRWVHGQWYQAGTRRQGLRKHVREGSSSVCLHSARRPLHRPNLPDGLLLTSIFSRLTAVLAIPSAMPVEFHRGSLCLIYRFWSCHGLRALAALTNSLLYYLFRFTGKETSRQPPPTNKGVFDVLGRKVSRHRDPPPIPPK